MRRSILLLAMVVFMMLTALPAASAQVHGVSQAACGVSSNAGANSDGAKANAPVGAGPIPVRNNPNFDMANLPGNGGMGTPGGCDAKPPPD